MVQKFIRFLRENGVFEEYLHYLDHPFISSLPAGHKTINHALKVGGNLSPIDYSFDWDATDEGFEFWEHLDYDWRDYIRTANL